MENSFLRHLFRGGLVLSAFIGASACPLSLHAAAVRSIEVTNEKISGVVVDAETGEALPGVAVSVTGRTARAVTDAKGHFSIDATTGVNLRFSFIGYETATVKAVNGMTVQLRIKDNNLNEAVVVGYGVQRRNSMTGSMQTVKGADLTSTTTTPNVGNMLVGKVPGVDVVPGSGQPGSMGSIIIRGKSTINGSTDPLWVIDGVIVGSDPGDINPDDIQSFTILKDAASTAIYGSQGANGVIVVTTKHAATGNIKIGVTAKTGISVLNNGHVHMMNGQELYDYYSSFSNASEIAFPRWNKDLRNSNFDWWKEATHIGSTQEYGLTLSGGTEKMRNFFSIATYKENGAVKGYDYTRFNLRYKLEFHPYTWLTIRPSFDGSKTNIEDRQRDVTSMYSMLPWDNPYDEKGKPVRNYSSTWVNSNSTNYLYELQYNWSKSNEYRFNGNFDFDIRLTDWLTFSSVNSYRWFTEKDKSYTDPRTSGAEDIGRVSESSSIGERRYTNQLLRFDKSFRLWGINALLGYEFNDGKFSPSSSSGTGIMKGYSELDVTTTPEAVGGNDYEWAVQSYFINANAQYDNKYMAQLSLRRDGASNFGANKKYGNFYSISAGWVISQEKWFTPTWVDYMKLRAAYGSVGQRPHTLFPQYSLYNIGSSYNGTPGALLSQIGNPNLTWEKTFTTGIGLDLNILKCLRLTFDYYHKKTNNLLYQVPISGVVGVTSIWNNIGEMTNNGFEFSLGWDIINRDDLYWGFNANFGTNKNEIKKLYSGASQIILNDNPSSATTLLKPGLSIDTYYLREWAGVDKDNGRPMWYKTDDNGNRVITHNYAEANPVTLNKDANPDFYGGFSSNVRWKGFDAQIVFGFSVGGYLYNYSREEYDSDGAYTDRNQMRLKKGWSRWTKPGDNATHPLASYNNDTNSNKRSSRYLEDASFLKLRSLNIGYTWKLPQWSIESLRLYFSAENLFTITKYSGVDPELPASNLRDNSGARFASRSMNAGPAVYPSVRRFSLGLNINF